MEKKEVDFHKIKCGIELSPKHDEFYESLQNLVDIVKSLKQEVDELKEKSK